MRACGFACVCVCECACVCARVPVCVGVCRVSVWLSRRLRAGVSENRYVHTFGRGNHSQLELGASFAQCRRAIWLAIDRPIKDDRHTVATYSKRSLQHRVPFVPKSFQNRSILFHSVPFSDVAPEIGFDSRRLRRSDTQAYQANAFGFKHISNTCLHPTEILSCDMFAQPKYNM